MAPSTPRAADDGLLGARVPAEEIRFGVILNGGVSMAVWMGGAVLELDRLTRARRDDAPGGSTAYRTLLELAGCTARADVITGTSAGGINGAALALAQVNELTRLELLRDVWTDEGQLEQLLRPPFTGAPNSLLRGDEFFLPQLNAALGRLATPAKVRPREVAPVDLTLTATVLGGSAEVTVDSLGQQLPQKITAGRFRWRRLPHSREADPFAPEELQRTVHRMALASRCTAGFPLAFEPCFVPVKAPGYEDPADPRLLTERQRLRPDMSSVVRSWGTGDGDRSRYAVDGGALANMPTRDALEAVEAMPADGPVRRVMLLLFPHAPLAAEGTSAEPDEPPTLVQTATGLLGAMSAQGGRTYVEALAEHNRVAAGRRGTRADLLATLQQDRDGGTVGERLEALVRVLHGQYRQLRLWRAARDVVTYLPPSEGWTVESARRAAERAQLAWLAEHGGVPYVSETPPTSGRPIGAWEWGAGAAYGVAEAAADVLRRLVWVLPPGPDFDKVRAARAEVSAVRRELAEARALVDDVWRRPELAGLAPRQALFTLRLAHYERMMRGGDGSRVAAAIEAVVRHEGEAFREPLTRALLPPPGTPGAEGGAAGRRMRDLVDRVAVALGPALVVLVRQAAASPEPATAPGDDLTRWRDLLAPGGTPLGDAELVVRLLQLEIAGTTVGDEVRTGATLPVDVVQLSAHTDNDFADHSRTGDDKLGGMAFRRFGGFLKRSWRVNDWTWGRIDAATVLCRTVLDPQRVRRVAVLSGKASADPQKANAVAAATVAATVARCFPDGAPDDVRFAALREQSVAELAQVCCLDTESGDLPPTLRATAGLIAWALHQSAVCEELPALAAAVRADRADGASRRSNGERLLAEHGALLDRVEAAAAAGQPVSPVDRAAALRAFDRAGVGRESISDESGSDQMLRVVATATAVAATLADSDRSGLAVAKPVTRAVRGAVMVPYWLVRGLASGGRSAGLLGVLGLSLGGVLLTLALFGLLPNGLAGPAGAVGAALLLAALGYSALRTGTLLHGLVLLSPVVPLVAFAAQEARRGSEAGESAERGLAALVVVLALTAGLIGLGSLPANRGSVWAALESRAVRYRVPPVRPGRARGPRTALRFAHGLAAPLLSRRALAGTGALLLLAAAVAGFLTGWRAVEDRVVDGAWDRVAVLAALIAVFAVLVVVGGVIAHRNGCRLRLLRPGAGPLDEPFAPVAHPAGAAVTWAVLYGAGYLALATALMVAAPATWEGSWWYKAAVVTTVGAGVLLTVVVPVWLPMRAIRRVERAEVERAQRLAAAHLPTPAEQDREYARDLAARGAGYQWLVEPDEQDGVIDLTDRGLELLHAVREAGHVPVDHVVDLRDPQHGAPMGRQRPGAPRGSR